MAKLAVVALLGMVALSAALDAEIAKKTYKTYDEEKEHKGYKDYTDKAVTVHSTKANIKANHQEWDLLEKVGTTHPCNPQYEILGSTVSQESDLINKKGDLETVVGSVYWSGIVTKHDLCGDCKDYRAGEHHLVKNNYQITFEFTAEHKGQLVAGVVGDSIFSQEKVTASILGGSGAFEGAWGTVTWTYGAPKGKYTFDVYFPKVVEVEKHEIKTHEHEKKEEKEHEEHEKKHEKKHEREHEKEEDEKEYRYYN